MISVCWNSQVLRNKGLKEKWVMWLNWTWSTLFISVETSMKMVPHERAMRSRDRRRWGYGGGEAEWW